MSKLQKPSKPALEIPASLWYSTSSNVSHAVIVDFLSVISSNLSEQHKVLGLNLINLSIFKRLMSDDWGNWAVEYSEGPLALLLIFALRAHLNDKYGVDNAVQIADDRNLILPKEFEQLDTYLDEFLNAYCIANGWHSDEDFSVKGKSVLCESATSFGREMFVSIERIRPFAVMMGCFPGFVDLSALETNVPAGFF